MSPTPRPSEPQLTPEGFTAETGGVAEAERGCAARTPAETGEKAARPFGNLTENLTTCWNVGSR